MPSVYLQSLGEINFIVRVNPLLSPSMFIMCCSTEAAASQVDHRPLPAGDEAALGGVQRIGYRDDRHKGGQVSRSVTF